MSNKTLNKTASEKVRETLVEQLKIVQERLKYYRSEEKRLVKAIENSPLPGQMSSMKQNNEGE